jgi:hypothetical protein
MSFVYPVDVDTTKITSYAITFNLTDTNKNTGGINVFNGNLNSLTNKGYIIFGGGGEASLGKNALQIDSTSTITSLVNTGSFCGGGGGGAQIPAGSSCKGGAGGGGGGSNASGNSIPGNGGNGFSNGETGDGGAGGGGGGFYKFGGGSKTALGGKGTLAGGGGGMYSNNVGNAGDYGAGVSENDGGGGAGGGKGGGNNGGGGGGGGQAGGFGYNGGYGIFNYGSITTLENQQGIGFGLGALFYAGNLPTNYNIIIQNDASFGQLFYTGWANLSKGTLTNFDISTSSTLSSSQKNYDAVLVNIKPLVTSGTNWKLNYVPAGGINCKNKIVTIGGVNYDSYDLIVNASTTYITLTSLVPSRNQIGQSITINFTTNLAINLNDSVNVNFGTSKTQGTITKIDSTTASVSVNVPSGSGTVPVTMSIGSTTSNSLDFTYTTSPSSTLVINFIGDNQITDTYNDLYAFVLNTKNPTTSFQFTVTINNENVYNNCVFKFNLTTPNVPTSLNSVQLSVTNNSKTYNLIYNPYINGNNNIKTYITYTDDDTLYKIPFSYTYINGINPWYFVNSSTSTDTSNDIIYNKEGGNFISATSTKSNPSSILLQNIGTLGMCGASNAFIKGLSSDTQDTINASISWCFYCLYNLTQGFSY